MADIRLVVARQLVWDEDRCRREPTYRAFIIGMLECMAQHEEMIKETEAEVAMLIRKLRAVGMG